MGEKDCTNAHCFKRKIQFQKGFYSPLKFIFLYDTLMQKHKYIHVTIRWIIDF